MSEIELSRSDQVKKWVNSNDGLARIGEALPMTFKGKEQMFIQQFMFELSGNANLQKCTRDSVIKSFLQSVSLGLAPGGKLGQAYLVPFGQECTFMIGYKGFISLARRSNLIDQIESRVVNEGDEFDIEFGTSQKIMHRPCLGKPGQAIGVYAIAHFKDGGKQVEFMTLEQVEAIRKRSRSGHSGPWKTDFDQMARKTVIRRLMNYLPLSADDIMAQAIMADHDEVAPLHVDGKPALRVQSANAMLENGPDDADPVNAEIEQDEPRQSGKPTAEELASYEKGLADA